MHYILGGIEATIYILNAIFVLHTHFKNDKKCKTLLQSGLIVERKPTFLTFKQWVAFIIGFPFILLPFLYPYSFGEFLPFLILFLLNMTTALLLQSSWMGPLVFTPEGFYSLYAQNKLTAYENVTYAKWDGICGKPHDRCSLLFYANKKRYKAFIRSADYEKLEPLFREHAMQNEPTVDDSKPTLFTKSLKIIGRILMIFGITMFLLCMFRGFFIARDYKVMQDTEYILVGQTSVVADNNHNLYCLSEGINAVNVYHTNGEFKYSLTMPYSQNGRGSIYIKNDLFYVEDKGGTIYYYLEGEFQGKASQGYENDTLRVYDQSDNLQYEIQVAENCRYAPLYVEGDTLYAIETGTSRLLTFENGTLVAQEPYDYENPPVAYGEFQTMDNESNTYWIQYFPPLQVVKQTPDGRFITFGKENSFIHWISQSPMWAWLIGAMGVLLYYGAPRLAKRSKKKKKTAL